MSCSSLRICIKKLENYGFYCIGQDCRTAELCEDKTIRDLGAVARTAARCQL